jgi:hypothetical protein
MRKRKWIIDNQGHLAGIWNDCEPATTVTAAPASRAPRKLRALRVEELPWQPDKVDKKL